MKNSNDTIRNRNRNLPAFSAVPQPTALPRAPCYVRCTVNSDIILIIKLFQINFFEVMKNIFKIQKNMANLIHRKNRYSKRVLCYRLEDCGTTNINIMTLYNVARRSLLCRYRNQCFDRKQAAGAPKRWSLYGNITRLTSHMTLFLIFRV